MILAYDFGTGGIKASVFDVDGNCLAEGFEAYETLYPNPGWHEQRPEDWWQATVNSTKMLIEKGTIDPAEISCIGISGHSLGVVPLDKDGNLLREATPIWSDSRPTATQTEPFFSHISEEGWYMMTGCGFPAPLYSVFKLMWFRDNEPEMFGQVDKVIGTKDYINYRLTSAVVTDNSYASGCGVYDLVNRCYSDQLIEASGLPRHIFADIVPSTQVIGTLTTDAAAELGLSATVKVVAGGVDNSCMALGAGAFVNGRSYNSLGSSSWIAVSSDKPVLDADARPYVFDHVVPNQYASATAIFSAGTSHNWVRDNLCRDLKEQAEKEDKSIYNLMEEEASQVPAGSNKLLFNPSLAGGSSLDPSPKIRGAFIGLDLGHDRADIIRATMEGVALGLRVALDKLAEHTDLQDEMIVVGGGANSPLWRQIYADVYNKKIIRTKIGQQAAALGAAAIAAVGSGLWESFDKLDQINSADSTDHPQQEVVEKYETILPVYRQATGMHAKLGDLLATR